MGGREEGAAGLKRRVDSRCCLRFTVLAARVEPAPPAAWCYGSRGILPLVTTDSFHPSARLSARLRFPDRK